MKICAIFFAAFAMAQDQDQVDNVPENNFERNYSPPANNNGYGNTGTDASQYSGLKCWHCDAMSFEDCEAYGQEKECHVRGYCPKQSSYIFISGTRGELLP